MQRQIIVCLFHSLYLDTSGDSPRQNEFRLFIRRLTEEGYHFCTMEEATGVYGSFAAARKIRPKSVWLTFDDGFANVHLYGTDILLEYGARATICPEFNKLGDGAPGNRLSATQLLAMKQSGVWDIGSHGYLGHGGPPYASADFADWVWPGYAFVNRPTKNSVPASDADYKRLLKDDLQLSQTMAVAATGQLPTCWVYPGGEQGDSDVKPLMRQVMDELGMVGFTVTAGDKVTYWGEKHWGKRSAISTWATFSGYGYHAVVIGYDWQGACRVGDQYLLVDHGEFQWFDLNLRPLGSKFWTDPHMSGWVRLFYDQYTGYVLAASDLGLGIINPSDMSFVYYTADAGFGELRGFVADATYYYVVIGSNGSTQRVLKAGFNGTGWDWIGTICTILGIPTWSINAGVTLVGGLLYVPIKDGVFNAIAGLDLADGLKLKTKIHPPAGLAISWHIACPDGDLEEWWFNWYGGNAGVYRTAKYKPE